KPHDRTDREPEYSEVAQRGHNLPENSCISVSEIVLNPEQDVTVCLSQFFHAFSLPVFINAGEPEKTPLSGFTSCTSTL
ncbi:MAG: hypothetical protein PUE04_07710, partial [Lachnospira sp.]|nr:hypothetical protein [Lachnospira sp.]